MPINSEVVVWFGNRNRWLIWEQRSSEVAILGTDVVFDCGSSTRPKAFAALDMLDLIALSFKGDEVPKDWKDEFMLNYGPARTH